MPSLIINLKEHTIEDTLRGGTFPYADDAELLSYIVSAMHKDGWSVIISDGETTVYIKATLIVSVTHSGSYITIKLTNCGMIEVDTIRGRVMVL